MATYVQDDWSDSDDQEPSGVETSVLLGVPDDVVDVPTDLRDAAVSRIGGHPAFLPAREPPITSSYCKVCENPMELLVQMWCPFEDSPMDRALYIWGCSRVGCQKKQGCVRAWRGLRYNTKYAAKLKKKLERKQEKEGETVAAQVEAKRLPRDNPFSASSTSTIPTFGLGTQIFGGEPVQALREPNTTDTDSDDSEESLLTAMARTVISDSPWQSAPAYTPMYLSTVSEYLPPQSESKLPSDSQILDSDDGKGDSPWISEKYENSMAIDPVFERFTRRVGAEGEQCVRYELNGVPLPFASDEVFRKLFPLPPTEPLPVTKADFKVVQTPKRTYDPSAVTPCPACKSKRVFECQLMPNK